MDLLLILLTQNPRNQWESPKNLEEDSYNLTYRIWTWSFFELATTRGELRNLVCACNSAPCDIQTRDPAPGGDGRGERNFLLRALQNISSGGVEERPSYPETWREI